MYCSLVKALTKELITFLLLAVLKTVVLLNIFVETVIFSVIISWWIESKKDQYLNEIIIQNFCKNVKVLTVSFDQFNVP